MFVCERERYREGEREREREREREIERERETERSGLVDYQFKKLMPLWKPSRVLKTPALESLFEDPPP